MKRLLSFLFLVILLAVPTPGGAQAQGGSGFGLRPQDPTQAYFHYVVEPGDVVADTLQAINVSDADIPLNLVVSRASTANTGGLAFAGVLPKKGEAGTWLTLRTAPGPIVVPAHGSLDLPFTVAIPNDAKPGDYLFGFLASQFETKPALLARGGFQVQVVSQAAVSVMLTIPGGGAPRASVQAVSLVEDTVAPQAVIAIANRGAVGWRGQGQFRLRSLPDGKVLIQRPFTVGYLLPGETIPYPIAFGTPLSPGSYEASITLGDDPEPFTKTLTVAASASLPAATASAQPLAALFAGPRQTATPALPKPLDASGPVDDWQVMVFMAGLLALVAIGLFVLAARQKARTTAALPARKSTQEGSSS